MNIVPMLILLAGLAFGVFLIAKNWSADMSIEGELKGIKNEVTAMREELAKVGEPVDLGPINARLDGIESALESAVSGFDDVRGRLTTLEQLVGKPSDPAEDPDGDPAPAPAPEPLPPIDPPLDPAPVDGASGDAGATI